MFLLNSCSPQFIEAFKELLRVVLLAIIPISIEGIYNGSIDLKLISITGAIAGLRFLDKYLHELGKKVTQSTGEESSLTNGLTRF